MGVPRPPFGPQWTSTGSRSRTTFPCFGPRDVPFGGGRARGRDLCPRRTGAQSTGDRAINHRSLLRRRSGLGRDGCGGPPRRRKRRSLRPPPRTKQTLTAQLTTGAQLVVTDSNRRAASAVYTFSEERSRLLGPDEELDRPASDLYGRPRKPDGRHLPNDEHRRPGRLSVVGGLPASVPSSLGPSTAIRASGWVVKSGPRRNSSRCL